MEKLISKSINLIVWLIYSGSLCTYCGREKETQNRNHVFELSFTAICFMFDKSSHLPRQSLLLKGLTKQLSRKFYFFAQTVQKYSFWCGESRGAVSFCFYVDFSYSSGEIIFQKLLVNNFDQKKIQVSLINLWNENQHLFFY